MASNQPPVPAYDWSRFVKRVNINAPVQKIYKAWATSDGLEKWFLRKAGFTAPDGTARTGKQLLKQGDQYDWYWHGWTDETVEHGAILEANGKDRFSFSFGKAGTVTITIGIEQNTPLVSLLQQNIPTDEESKVYYHLGCTQGWVFYLANLKSILEGGIDLRNKNIELKEVITA